MFAFEKLPGLPRDRVVGAIEPVLRAHGLSGVELIWRMDHRGRVLQVTLERAGSGAESARAAAVEGAEAHADGAEAGGTDVASQAGVTLDECSRVSRDLSTALDVAEAIDRNYRLEVGTPGLDRRLYGEADYRRFAGKRAKLKLAEPIDGRYALVGELSGVDADGQVLIDADGRRHAIALDSIRAGQLEVDWNELGFGSSASRGPSPGARGSRAPAGRASGGRASGGRASASRASGRK